jgi:hypothetical protein
MLLDLTAILSAIVVLISPIGLFFRQSRRTAAIAFSIAFITLIFESAGQKLGPSASPTNSALSIAAAAPAKPERSTPASLPVPRVAAHTIGKAKVCLTDDDVKIPAGKQIELPATTVFDDNGIFDGDKSDPTKWHRRDDTRFFSLISMSPIVFTAKSRCSEIAIKILRRFKDSATDVTVDDSRMFSASDVINYPIPAQKPLVEIGKLFDDISVQAVLTADVSEDYELPPPADDATQPARCLEGAQKLAVAVGAATGRQTSSIVALTHPAANEASYGCQSLVWKHANIFVSWDGTARPPVKTTNFIARSAAYLTGATENEIQRELAACVAEALKPKSEEMADREFRGVKIECQAFARDGGGGSVTIHRRFGTGPDHADLTDSQHAEALKSANKVKAQDEAKAQETLAFAKWWQDPSIPKEVKTFAMMTARIMALSEKCPEVKPNTLAIANNAAEAGIFTADLEPGGKYYALMAEMTQAMRKGVAAESHNAACEAARKYK